MWSEKSARSANKVKTAGGSHKFRFRLTNRITIINQLAEWGKNPNTHTHIHTQLHNKCANEYGGWREGARDSRNRLGWKLNVEFGKKFTKICPNKRVATAAKSMAYKCEKKEELRPIQTTTAITIMKVPRQLQLQKQNKQTNNGKCKRASA